MIDETRREMARRWHQEGLATNEIAYRLSVDVKTVHRILNAPTDTAAAKPRSDKVALDEGLLRDVFNKCRGYAQRVQEILAAQHGVNIGYSTLTRLLRDLGLRTPSVIQHAHVPDYPGEEMQHDTSPFRVIIAGKQHTLVLSGLYLRYSKQRYIKFYPRFNRFVMKCFMYEALMFWGYSAKRCIVDNTNLVVHYGTGEAAVFHDEMVAFARQFGFVWQAHAIGHANRKGGKERNFHTVDTNFLPGREFSSIEDLNEQGFTWSTAKFAARPQSKTRLIPLELFEIEKPSLVKLPSYIHPPYQPHRRVVDKYGYVSFNANYFWTPCGDGANLQLLEYAKEIVICTEVSGWEKITYPLPAWQVHNEKYCPPGQSKVMAQPQNRKKGCQEELARLRRKGPPLDEYLDFVLSTKNQMRQKPLFIRNLYHLSNKLTAELFTNVIRRALQYRITTIDALERMAAQLFTGPLTPPALPPIDREYESRQAYLDGQLSVEDDLSAYENLTDTEDIDENTDNQAGPSA